MDELELRSIIASDLPERWLINICRDHDIYWPVIIALRLWQEPEPSIRLSDGRKAVIVEIG